MEKTKRPKMKVVGLLSGGKDSCYNLCHCVKKGHEVVALATLGPEPGKDELDSYLYQTVGQDGVHFIAQALELPLYRRIIYGTAVERKSVYGSRSHDGSAGIEGDETEDMLTLLSQVKSKHPEINAVSVGAILSNYQRVRVEHVCQRLQLTVLAYLWQRDQSELLREMISAPIEAVLIKVASIGLGPMHLGKTLKEVEPTLNYLNSKYGVHVCGEGGEYETFTLDCPLFKSKVILESSEVKYHPESSPMAPVAYLKLLQAKLKPKPSGSTDILLSKLKVPSSFDYESVRVLRAFEDDYYIVSNRSRSSVKEPIDSCSLEEDLKNAPVSVSEYSGWVVFTSVVGPKLLDPNYTYGSIEEEANDVFNFLKQLLTQHSLDFTDISHINLSLESMEDFLPVNSVYSSRFGTSPPTRACVALKLGQGRIMLDAICRRTKSGLLDDDRTALHVQSRSYWAPANIGPYSQAVMVGSKIFIAGQIGLIPASLMLPSPPSFKKEAALSLQHARRIKKTFGEEKFVEGVICYLTDFSNVEQARFVWRNSTSIFDERIPIMFIEVTGLPRGAMIEWQFTFQTSGRVKSDGDGDDDEDNYGLEKKFIPTYFGGSNQDFRGFGFRRSKDLTIIGTTDKEKVFDLPSHNVNYLRVFCIPGISQDEIKDQLRKCLRMKNFDGISIVKVSKILINFEFLKTVEPKVGFYLMGSLL